METKVETVGAKTTRKRQRGGGSGGARVVREQTKKKSLKEMPFQKNVELGVGGEYREVNMYGQGYLDDETLNNRYMGEYRHHENGTKREDMKGYKAHTLEGVPVQQVFHDRVFFDGYEVGLEAASLNAGFNRQMGAGFNNYGIESKQMHDARYSRAETGEYGHNGEDREGQVIHAYAKLEGPMFQYYIKELSVTLGRSSVAEGGADISLGNNKALSRKHARIFYNYADQEFYLEIYGKNGCFLNEQFISKGMVVPLRHKSLILMGNLSFAFLLPTDSPTPPPYMSHTEAYAPPLPNPSVINKIPPLPPHSTAPGPLETSRSFPYDGASRSRVSSGDASTPGTLVGDGITDSERASLIARFSSAGADMVRILPSTAKPPNLHNARRYTKPQLSYASLIAQAINSTENKRVTLNGIYTYIMTNYPYYREAQSGWQNSIRHNLSLNKAFIKVQRENNQPGKGAYWTINDNHKDQFDNGIYKRVRRSSKKRSADCSEVDTAESESKRSRNGTEGSVDTPVGCDDSLSTAIIDHNSFTPENSKLTC